MREVDLGDSFDSLADFQNEAAIDAKYTTFSLNRRMAARAISGPTADQQPPFAWSRSPEALREVPHDGHPGGKGLGLGWRCAVAPCPASCV